MNRTDLIDLFNYNAWANARILAGVELWQILTHVVNHCTQHRTDLARYLTDCSHAPGDLSLLGFLAVRADGLSA